MYDFKPTTEEFANITEWLKKEYSQISTGRANPALLDSVMVDNYGSMQPVKNMASITTEDARTLRIGPWDKSQVKVIEKAIIDSKLPVTVSTDAEGVRVAIPQMTEESKKEIVKLVKTKLEDGRVRVRGWRDKTIKDIEAGEFSKDEVFGFKEDLQKKVDAANEELQQVFTAKEKDIMTV